MDDKFLELSKQYLQSNACGMWDGALKANTHRQLCVLFLANKLQVSRPIVEFLEIDDKPIISSIREATLSLTDNLDDEIGFPLETAPNYKKLTPMFAGKFKKLANDWLDDRTDLMSDYTLKNIVNKICKRKFEFVYPALESYGFEFVGGVGDGENPYLTMKSKLGQVVTVKPNMYFGCSFILDKGINDD